MEQQKIIERILEQAEIGPGMEVLYAACGNGALLPHFQILNVSSVTAVDTDPEIEYSIPSNTVILQGDVETMAFEQKFDRIVVLNALPRFPYPRRLIKRLTALLKDGGILTVAQTPDCMENVMPVEELKKLFDKYYNVELMIHNRWMYQVCGMKRDPLEHSHCGITHSHGDLVHTHSHGDEAHTHMPAENATPIEELLALMRYLVSHNDAHAQEVADLAGELLTAGKNTAYDEIMDAVSDFDIVNAKLDSILCRLTVEEY